MTRRGRGARASPRRTPSIPQHLTLSSLVSPLPLVHSYYISRHSLHTLPDVGLMRFRDEVYLEVRSPAKDAVLAAVAAERAGDPVDRPLLKNVLSISIEVGMGALDYYEADFEAAILAATADYYSRVAAAWVEADSCPDYMAKAEGCLAAEEERVDAYLHATTRPKLLAVAEAELLTRHQAALLDKDGSGVAALLRDDRRPDLARMYRLFARVGPDGLRPVAGAFQAHVESEGQALVRRADEAAAARKEKGAGGGAAGGAAAPAHHGAAAAAAFARPAPGAGAAAEQAFVRDVVTLHDKYLGYVADCFAGASAFHKALKEAFEAFCNKSVGGAHVAELMANTCDQLLRKGVAGAGDAAAPGGAPAGTPTTVAGTAAAAGPADATAAVEGELDKVVKLLAYVSEKDMFAEYYRKRLARRLLAGGGASAGGGSSTAGAGAGGINDDAERGVLARLKQQCGAQFTSKMEGMVTDLALAREKQDTFEAWRRRQPGDGGSLGLDLSVTVLTTGYWPSYGAAVETLPGPMAAGVALFARFYEDTTKHRKLTWMHGLGSATVRGAFGPRPLELVVSTLQAAVLLCFNDAPGETLSYEEVKGRLGLPDEETARTLYSFACGRHKVLLKAPDNKKPAPGDSFTVNAAFTDRMRRVKIPVPSVEDRRAVVQDVGKDRAHAVDAAVVRVMKARKALTHAQLTGEVVPQLARMFKPDVRLIKKRIETLIDREYLARGEVAGTYIYLA